MPNTSLIGQELLNDLLRKLDRTFDETELQDLCFVLDVKYDTLSGTNKTEKERALVERLERYNRIPELVSKCRTLRPHITWGEASGQPDQDQFTTRELNDLREKLIDGFSNEELQDVCADLGVDYESLSGTSKAAKARELVAYLDRRGRVPDFISLLRARRPNIAWEGMSETNVVSPAIGGSEIESSIIEPTRSAATARTEAGFISPEQSVQQSSENVMVVGQATVSESHVSANDVSDGTSVVERQRSDRLPSEPAMHKPSESTGFQPTSSQQTNPVVTESVPEERPLPVAFEQSQQPVQSDQAQAASVSKVPQQPYQAKPETTLPEQTVSAPSESLKSPEESQSTTPDSETPKPSPQEVPELTQRQEKLEVPPRGLADTTGEKKDLLGFLDYAQALADFIRDKQTEKPLTIGVDAPWGMGKTTLMKMLMNKLNGEEEKQKAAVSSEVVARPKKVGRVFQSLKSGILRFWAWLNRVVPWGKAKVAEEAKPVSQPPLLTVWFDAWTYDQEESLWAALVLEILTQIRKQSKWHRRLGLWLELNWKRFDKSLFLKSLLKLLAYLASIGIVGVAVVALASLLLDNKWQVSVARLSDYLKYLYTVGLVGLVPVLYSVIKDLLNGVVRPFDLNVDQYIHEPNYKEKVGFLAQFKKDYECVIGCVARDLTQPLVIFIDDLDRCAPPKPAEIIEAINLLLDAPNCVFVLGMDAQMVAASLEAKYKDLKTYVEDVGDPGGLTLGQRFLEKIVQINFHIPRADPQRVDSFISAIVGATGVKPPSEPSDAQVTEAVQSIEAKQSTGMSTEEAARQVEAERPDLGETTIAKAKQEVFVTSFNDSETVLEAIREAKQYLGFNPRKIKRFVNNFRLQALIANRRGMFEAQEVRLDLLSKFLVFQMRWPGALDAAMTDRSFIENLKQARSLRYETRMIRASDKETLERFLANPYVRRWVDAAELVGLLESIGEDDLKRLPFYLYFAQITIKPRLTL